MKRNYGLDVLKFIAAFLVICIHFPFPGFIGKIISPVTRVAVPIFFMITGYYYSHTRENKRESIQLMKILKLFVGANIVYIVYSMYRYWANDIDMSVFWNRIFSANTIRNLVFFNTSPFRAHLWYLGAILYVLLIVFLWEKRWNREKL